MSVAIIWAILFAAGGLALGAWTGGIVGAILTFVGFVLASMSIHTGLKMRR